MIIAVAAFETDQEMTWEYNTAYQGAPSLMLALGQAQYTDSFGNPPYIILADSFKAVVQPNNGGASLFCASVGFAYAGTNNQRIQYGTTASDEEFTVQLNGFTGLPCVFLSLQNAWYQGAFGYIPKVVSASQDSVTINPCNRGGITHWVAIGPGAPGTVAKVQTVVQQSDTDFVWTFNSSFDAPPTIIVTLQNGSYRGAIGHQPQIADVGRTSATIRPCNGGCIVNCVAFG
jgi:hypothetical protein